MIEGTDERATQGRQLGSAWSQDHRSTRMGDTNLMELLVGWHYKIRPIIFGDFYQLQIA